MHKSQIYQAILCVEEFELSARKLERTELIDNRVHVIIIQLKR